MDHAHLEKTCQEFLDSLVGHKSRHTLCLNIAEPGFEAGEVAEKYLVSKGAGEVNAYVDPSPTEFERVLAGFDEREGQFAVVTFEDLDKKPKCMDMLFEHVKKETVGGKLVVVSKAWNSDNTDKERELRKYCLFYQQNLAVPPKKPRR